MASHPLLPGMRRGFTIRLLDLARRVGLVLIALAVLAAPIGSVGHAAIPDTAHHAGAAQDGASSAPCDTHDSKGPGAHCSAGGAEFCHVVAGPLIAPIGAALIVLVPSSVTLGTVNSRLPGGLDIPPPLGPPRIDS